MADVYSAYDTVGQRRVAIKLFREGTIDEAILAESFRRETQALEELKHPGIVELFDAGKDDVTGRLFIVMEWVDLNLSEWLRTTDLGGWDDFYEAIGRDILDALSLAHARHLEHRDLKTKNILISEDNHVKLADFGIAKLKKFIEPGVTLAGFTSRPFTPPYDSSAQSYTRDVYGFGIVALDCLTHVDLKDYEDVAKALAEFDAPPRVVELIELAVSFEPERRPQHAGILLTELEKVWQEREPEFRKPDCYLKLSRPALKTLRNELSLENETEIRNIVTKDLNNCGIRPYEVGNRVPVPNDQRNHQFTIFGERFRYHAIVAQRLEDHLLIANLSPSSSALLEKARESSLHPNYRFKFGSPTDSAAGKDVILDLQLKVEAYEVQRRREIEARADEQFFYVWDSILKAKTALEKNRSIPLRYNRVSPEGNRVTFSLTDFPDEDLVGQARIVRLQDGGVISGEVETVQGKELVLYVLYGSTSQLPQAGRLEFDTRAADVAVERQRYALDAVRFDRAVRLGLKKLIAHPENARTPIEIEDVNFAVPDLDNAKQKAVLLALGTSDFLVVEGPPGTGKTTFIAELIVQTLRRDPQSRILLTSQTHVALDNALERITNISSDAKIVRIANLSAYSRVAPEARKLLLRNQMDDWREEVLASGRQFLVEWAQQNGISASDVKFGMMLKELVSTRRDLSRRERDLAELEGELYESTGGDPEVSDSLLTEASATHVLDLRNDISRVTSDIKTLKASIKHIQQNLIAFNDFANDLIGQPDEELEEWVAAYLPRSPATEKLLALLSIFSEWEMQFGRREEFEVALLASAQLVASTCLGVAGVKGANHVEYDLCIIDEASKATPTEVLIPISRSRRWILVGDQRQLSPFQDPELRKHETLERYDLKRDDLKTTLFDHLIERLPDTSKAGLSVQHRMVAPIGNLVSECFYDGRLQNASKSVDTRLSLALPSAVTWFSTSGFSDRSESIIESSFVNRREIQFIERLLERINWAAGLSKGNYSVAVITGYSKQRKELERSISKSIKALENLKVECNTVDAFQGREADIAIYSVTRSNNRGDIGFLHESERINVAMSRGRFYLAIVGDHVFCRQAHQDQNPFRRILNHIDLNPEGCAIKEISG